MTGYERKFSSGLENYALNAEPEPETRVYNLHDNFIDIIDLLEFPLDSTVIKTQLLEAMENKVLVHFYHSDEMGTGCEYCQALVVMAPDTRELMVLGINKHEMEHVLRLRIVDEEGQEMVFSDGKLMSINARLEEGLSPEEVLALLNSGAEIEILATNTITEEAEEKQQPIQKGGGGGSGKREDGEKEDEEDEDKNKDDENEDKDGEDENKDNGKDNDENGDHDAGDGDNHGEDGDGNDHNGDRSDDDNDDHGNDAPGDGDSDAGSGDDNPGEVDDHTGGRDDNDGNGDNTGDEGNDSGSNESSGGDDSSSGSDDSGSTDVSDSGATYVAMALSNPVIAGTAFTKPERMDAFVNRELFEEITLVADALTQSPLLERNPNRPVFSSLGERTGMTLSAGYIIAENDSSDDSGSSDDSSGSDDSSSGSDDGSSGDSDSGTGEESGSGDGPIDGDDPGGNEDPTDGEDPDGKEDPIDGEASNYKDGEEEEEDEEQPFIPREQLPEDAEIVHTVLVVETAEETLIEEDETVTKVEVSIPAYSMSLVDVQFAAILTNSVKAGTANQLKTYLEDTTGTYMAQSDKELVIELTADIDLKDLNREKNRLHFHLQRPVFIKSDTSGVTRRIYSDTGYMAMLIAVNRTGDQRALKFESVRINGQDKGMGLFIYTRDGDTSAGKGIYLEGAYIENCRGAYGWHAEFYDGRTPGVPKSLWAGTIADKFGDKFPYQGDVDLMGVKILPGRFDGGAALYLPSSTIDPYFGYRNRNIIKNCTFENNLSDLDGGAVFIAGKIAMVTSPQRDVYTATTFENCKFINNRTANNGKTASAYPNINDVKITLNGRNGGGLTIGSNEAVSGNRNKADYENIIRDCIFNGNSAKGSGFGGGLKLYGDMYCTIENSNFYNNDAIQGGAMYLGGEATEPTVKVTISGIKGVEVYNNKARNGMVVLSNAEVTLTSNLTIRDNTIFGASGGGLITNANTANVFVGSGGQLNIYKNKYLVEQNDTGKDTYILSRGGGMHLNGNSSLKFTKTIKVDVYENESWIGGGISIGQNAKLLTESGSAVTFHVHKNEAKEFKVDGIDEAHGNGGGVYVKGTATSSFDGGKSAADPAKLVIQDNHTGETVSNNRGGGIHVNANAPLILWGPITVDISKNSALYGGGVSLGQGASLKTESGNAVSVSITKNEAKKITIGSLTTGNGGGIQMRSGAEFNMGAGVDNKNTAGGSGGGLFIEQSDASKGKAKFTLESANYTYNVTHNTGANSGGGIYAHNGEITVAGEMLLEKSMAGTHGGGIFVAVDVDDNDKVNHDYSAYQTADNAKNFKALKITDFVTFKGNTSDNYVAWKKTNKANPYLMDLSKMYSETEPFVADGVVNSVNPDGGENSDTISNDHDLNHAMDMPFHFMKRDSDSKEALAGAEFTLYQLVCTGNHTHDDPAVKPDSACWKVLPKETSEEDGDVNFGVLEKGTYALIETKVPEGYLDSAEQWRITSEFNTNTKLTEYTVKNKTGSQPIKVEGQYIWDNKKLVDSGFGFYKAVLNGTSYDRAVGAKFSLYELNCQDANPDTHNHGDDPAKSDCWTNVFTDKECDEYGNFEIVDLNAMKRYYLVETATPTKKVDNGTAVECILPDTGWYLSGFQMEYGIEWGLEDEGERFFKYDGNGNIVMLNQQKEDIGYKFQKVVQDGSSFAPVLGAKFSLYALECQNDDPDTHDHGDDPITSNCWTEIVKDKECDENGEFLLQNMSRDKVYYLVETVAPTRLKDGTEVKCVLPEKGWYMQAQEGSETGWDFGDPDDKYFALDDTGALVLLNQLEFSKDKLKIVKTVDGEYWEADTVDDSIEFELTITTEDGTEYITQLKGDAADGTFELPDTLPDPLPPGTYTVKETDPSGKYMLSKMEITIIHPDGTKTVKHYAGLDGGEFSIEVDTAGVEIKINNVTKSVVVFYKAAASDTNIRLAGATFSIYRCTGGHANADEHGKPGDDESCWELIQEGITSQTNGQINLQVPSGMPFALVETKAPSGYFVPRGYWIITLDENDRITDIATVGNVPAISSETQGEEKQYVITNLKPLELPFTGAYVIWTALGVFGLSIGGMLAFIKIKKIHVR